MIARMSGWVRYSCNLSELLVVCCMVVQSRGQLRVETMMMIPTREVWTDPHANILVHILVLILVLVATPCLLHIYSIPRRYLPPIPSHLFAITSSWNINPVIMWLSGMQAEGKSLSSSAQPLYFRIGAVAWVGGGEQRILKMFWSR